MGKDQRENMLGKKLKKFNFVKQLGSGSFGTVYQAVYENNKSLVAVKVMPKQKIKQSKKLQQLVASQIKVLKQCKNQNVIKFIDSFSSEKSVFIATQFCNGGDLEEYLKKNKQLPQSQATLFLKQILNGFKGLHEVGAMHRDFKTANVLLHNKVCKIADLGFAKQLKSKQMTFTVLGTDQTMAPQVHDQKPYGMQADIWSIGVVYYQLLFGKCPYQGRNQYQLVKKIKTTRPDYSSKQLSQESINFIDKCLVVDPEKRITWTQIYQHPLLQKTYSNVVQGMFRSRLSVEDNKKFYQKNQKQKKQKLKQNQNTIKQQSHKQIVFEDAGAIVQANMTKMQRLTVQRQEIENAIMQYETDIIQEINNKMFLIRILSSQQSTLQAVKAHHAQNLFIYCKKSYIDMRKFHYDVTHGYGKIKNYKYWDDFRQDQIYSNIISKIEQQVQLAHALAISYRQDIGVVTYQQDNIDQFWTFNVDSFIKDSSKQYWKDLASKMKQIKKNKKKQYVKCLLAIKFYSERDELEAQDFQRLIDTIDYEKEQKKLMSQC